MATVFGDVALTATLLARLTPHSSIHEFDWGSYRFAESVGRKQKPKKSVSCPPRRMAATSGPARPKKEMNLLLNPRGMSHFYVITAMHFSVAISI